MMNFGGGIWNWLVQDWTTKPLDGRIGYRGLSASSQSVASEVQVPQTKWK